MSDDATREDGEAKPRNPQIPGWVYWLVHGMDDAVKIPGTRVGVGWDALLGFLVPGVGDALTAASHLGLLGVAVKKRVPNVVLARMLGNAGIDVATGFVPVLGDLFDVAFRANRKNLELLERAVEAHARGEAGTRRSDYVFVGLVLAAIVALIVLPVLGVIALVHFVA